MKMHLLFVISSLLLVGAGCPTNESGTQHIDYEDDVKPLIEESTQSTTVRGSCNMIDTASHCEDYIGSMWTEEQMKLQCAGVGTWSKDACPYSENGGCRGAAETIVETVLWSYPYGGSPISGEELGYEIQACNALDPTSWTTPDALFLE